MIMYRLRATLSSLWNPPYEIDEEAAVPNADTWSAPEHMAGEFGSFSTRSGVASVSARPSSSVHR
jgi:hypothetical protein